MNDNTLKLFAGNAHPALAQEVAEHLKMNLGVSTVKRFRDGEIAVNIDESVRGADVYIVQPTCPPVNDNLMELLIMMDAMRRASAQRITAVIPYYGYARQERKSKARDPISAKLTANLIAAAGAYRVICMDLHAAAIQGFFDIPVDHLQGNPILTSYYREKYADLLDEFVAVSPDLGSVGRTRAFATRVDIPIAIIDKRRPKANVSEIMNIIGNVDGKRVILVDDMIDTAGTICNAAKALVERGAVEVDACCTHPVLSGPAIERIQDSPINELVVLNTIELPPEKKIPKIKELSVAPIFADAINRIHEGISISKLFD